MRRLWLLLPVVLAVIVLTLHAQAPDAAAIQRLEANIKPGDIPTWVNGHVPVIADYARYYAMSSQNGKRIIIGDWVAPFSSASKPVGIYPVATAQQFPVIMDGGCGIVHVLYDMDANRILSLKCNGDA